LQQHKTKKGTKKPQCSFQQLKGKMRPKKPQGGVCSNRKNKGKKNLGRFDAIKRGNKEPKKPKGGFAIIEIIKEKKPYGGLLQ